MFAQSSRKKCHDNTQYQTQLSEQAEEWRKPDRGQLTIWNLQPGTSCRNTLKSYASHPFSWHDIGMCAQETQNHTCRKKIMLKHSKASLQCRCFGYLGKAIWNFNIPPGEPWAFDHHLFQGSGEFAHNLGGVGNLNQKCQVNFFQMMRV